MIDITLIVLCWAISVLFGGIEAGLLSLDPVRHRQRVKQKLPAALRLNKLLRQPERLFMTVLLITNFANILGLLLLTRRFVMALGPIGYLAALVVALPIYLFLLAVLPKALFRRFPFRAVAALGGLLEWASTLLSPLLELGARLGGLILPRQAKKGARLFAGREELKQITAQSEQEGALTSTERVLIHNVVDFGTAKVRDVMVPLSKVVTVKPDTSVAEALKISNDSGVDRLPVVTPEGKPLGLVNALDIVLEKNPQDDQSVSRRMRRMVTATEDEPAYRVMQRLRAARLGLAGILDRQQNLRGVVMIEDLIRRLVQSS